MIKSNIERHPNINKSTTLIRGIFTFYFKLLYSHIVYPYYYYNKIKLGKMSHSIV